MNVELPVWAAVLIGIFGAVGGLSGMAALLNSRTSAKKAAVEGLAVLVAKQDVHIQNLERDLERIKCELRVWRKRFYRLMRWNKEQGLEPPPEIFDEVA